MGNKFCIFFFFPSGEVGEGFMGFVREGHNLIFTVRYDEMDA